MIPRINILQVLVQNHSYFLTMGSSLEVEL